MSLLANSNAIESGGYNILKSLRFSASRSTYMSRTPSLAGDRRTWTWSAWIKRGSLATGAPQRLFSVDSSPSGAPSGIVIQNDNTLAVIHSDDSGANNRGAVGTPLLRDPSAWYHIVVSTDTTQTTESNRIKIYINGNQVTTVTFGIGYPTLNMQGLINLNRLHVMGMVINVQYFDGYMSEINFIDGQALTPASFGETSVETGQWVAKKYTGTYGTNGFYLDFKDGTSTTTLGQDVSGNANNWTLTNFTRSTGVNDCWMLDVPAGNGSASAVQPSGNYATLNPLDISTGSKSGVTLSSANLRITANTVDRVHEVKNFPLPINSKIYIEFVWSSLVIGSNNQLIGVGNFQHQYRANGSIYRDNVSIGTYATYGINDVIGMAVDTSANTIQFLKNGSPQITITPTGVLAGSFIFAYLGANTDSLNVNFGQRSFAYTPPTGFKALCTSNLPNPAISKPETHFDTILWTGNNSTTRAIAGLNFSPDFTWIKCRGKNYNHHLVDSLRGSTNSLISNSTSAEVTNNVIGYVSSLDSNGFTVSFGTTNGQVVNESAQNYVAWNWRASDSTSTTNTDGSITSTVSANPTAGFSIVTYTGTGADATVGHGLGKIPAFIIVKNATSGVSYWCVQHKSLPVPSVLRLNETTASASATNIWSLNNNTSLIFNVGAANESNRPSNTMVAYCFAEIDGFSKFGSYTGNGSADGPFVYTGFRPKFVMVKSSSVGGANYTWVIKDSSRSPRNVASNNLYANLSNAEDTVSSADFDFTSNGFKLRGTYEGSNSNGVSYIYIAFAETPFQYSNAR